MELLLRNGDQLPGCREKHSLTELKTLSSSPGFSVKSSIVTSSQGASCFQSLDPERAINFYLWP